ncbi:MAG TPA: hypothetical protein IAA57_10760 [Candidatus Pullilachnospira intestinigallinarum]|nr:hypothetical protein [Candidatus Pullilachnospira intestinigallinarum]
MNHLRLDTNMETVNQAFRIALGDLYGNISLFQDGLLKEPVPVILAGLEYDTPWTRDAAINVWNGASLLFPEESRNTLLSVLTGQEGQVRIGGQYWDAIIWAAGAWQYYVTCGDREFLSLARQAVVNSLYWFEEREYDSGRQLFSGAACYGDGISAYGDEFSDSNQGESGIDHWPAANPDKCDSQKGGVGIPMYTLSTNCLYFLAYQLADDMARELGEKEDPHFSHMRRLLLEGINRNLWLPEEGTFAYYCSLLSGEHICRSQEALGLAFSLLCGVADESQRRQILAHCETTPAGIPCVWPPFARYTEPDGNAFGRHSGTVWPHAQGFWADAAKKSGAYPAFWEEFFSLTRHAVRDQQFGEIYHPLTGQLYGGRQELHGPITEWHSCSRQTWSATAYLRMVFEDLCGMEFSPEGIHFAPLLGTELNHLTLAGLTWRNARITLELSGSGCQVETFTVNGVPQKQPFLPARTSGDVSIRITLI